MMIEQYLDRLRAALIAAGADPAIAQDAVYDADEYLRANMAERADRDPAEAFAEVAEAYGTPEEVAAAYLETELTVNRALHAPAAKMPETWYGRFFGVVADPRAYSSMFYLFLAFATGIVYFTLIVTGVSLSLGLAILIIGVPIMLLVLAMVRAVSLAEGRLVEALLGERMPRRPRAIVAQGTVFERIKAWLADYRTWTSMLYMVLQMPLGIFYFTILVTGLATSAALVAAPFVQLVTGSPIAATYAYDYYLQPWAMPFSIAAGAALFVIVLHAARLLGRAHAAYAKVMLVGRFSETA